jgi:hypothetical protein
MMYQWPMRARLGCVIGLVLWRTITVTGQTAPAGLPQDLRAHLQNERFDVVSTSGGLPGGVRTELRTLFGDGRPTLELAEPGARYQGTSRRVNPRLPLRRLVAAGCSREDCLIYYERGGATHMWRVVLFHWTPYATRLEWGGTAPGGLATIEDVRRGVLSGAIKGSAGPW